jgi:hypothetical protein
MHPANLDSRAEIGKRSVVLVYANMGTGVSGSSRVLGAGAGVVMVVGGLLVFGGYRSGWVLGAAAAVALVIIGKAGDRLS